MTQTTSVILFALLAIFMTSCSWTVNLVIANNSNNEIFLRYIVPEDNQFFEEPKTYKYDYNLLKLSRPNENKRPESVPTNIRIIQETKELEIRLAPGQAVHVGVYYSFQPRHEIISKHNLRVLIDEDSTLTPTMVNGMFRHWKNIKVDLLEIVK
jgi:hypothetical protein